MSSLLGLAGRGHTARVSGHSALTTSSHCSTVVPSSHACIHALQLDVCVPAAGASCKRWRPRGRTPRWVQAAHAASLYALQCAAQRSGPVLAAVPWFHSSHRVSAAFTSPARLQDMAFSTKKLMVSASL